jgi:hypothetical protein
MAVAEGPVGIRQLQLSRSLTVQSVNIPDGAVVPRIQWNTSFRLALARKA